MQALICEQAPLSRIHASDCNSRTSRIISYLRRRGLAIETTLLAVCEFLPQNPSHFASHKSAKFLYA
jgi:hypothetical protein